MWQIVEKNGLKIAICEELNAYPWISQSFSTRRGGVSRPPFDSLNLGLHVGDEESRVLQNRAVFAGAMACDPDDLTCCRQVHGTEVFRVLSGHRGKGALHLKDAIPGCDAMITNVPGIPLLTFYADCVPVYILDPAHRAIGLAHAGRKGTFGEIAIKTLAAMTKEYKSEAAQCLAAIGPGIGPCCYSLDQIQEKHSRWKEGVIKSREGYFLDLPLINQQQLLSAGVKEENIFRSPWCTSCCTEEFFSYRAAGGRTGRMGAFFMIKDANSCGK